MTGLLLILLIFFADLFRVRLRVVTTYFDNFKNNDHYIRIIILSRASVYYIYNIFVIPTEYDYNILPMNFIVIEI